VEKIVLDVFSCGEIHYIPLQENPPVLDIHDLRLLLYGSSLRRPWISCAKNWDKPKSSRWADMVVAISKSTASDCHFEKVSLRKNSHVYQGFEGKQQILA